MLIRFKFPLPICLAFLAVFAQGCGSLEKAQTEAQLACSLSNLQSVSGQEVKLASAAFNNSTTPYELAQSFTTTVDMTIRYADLLLGAVGSPNPAAMLTLQIQGDIANQPDGYTKAQAVIQVAQLTSGQIKSYRFAFGNVQLPKGKKYWLRLSSGLPISQTDYLVWGGSAQNTLASGEAKYSQGTSAWSNVAISGAFGGSTQDLAFKLDCQ